jgi:hypothetical protein
MEAAAVIPVLLILVLTPNIALSIPSIIGAWDIMVANKQIGTITYYPNGTYHEAIFPPQGNISKPINGAWSLKENILAQCLNAGSTPLKIFGSQGFPCFTYHINGDVNNLKVAGTVYHLQRHAPF